MQEHKFIKKLGDDWIVYCVKTTGSFCTSLWRLGKYPKQQCPSCKHQVQ